MRLDSLKTSLFLSGPWTESRLGRCCGDMADEGGGVLDILVSDLKAKADKWMFGAFWK